MSLPTVFTPGIYNAYSAANLAGIVLAISRRNQSLVGDVSGAWTLPVAGDYVGAAYFAAMQQWIETTCPAFVDPAYSYAGLNVSPYYSGSFNFPTIPDHTFTPIDDSTAHPCLLKNAGFTRGTDGMFRWDRMRYATLSFPGGIPAQYDDTINNTANNTPAIGAVGRHSTTGKIYINTLVGAVHAWVLAADQTQLPTIITGWGQAAAGDIHSTQIEKQICDALKLLTVQFNEIGTGTVDKQFRAGGGTSPVSVAAAEANAAAAWGPFTPGPFIPQCAYAWSSYKINSSGPSPFDASAERCHIKPWVLPVSNGNAQTWGSSRTFQWLNYSRPLTNAVFNSTFSPPVPYTAIGDTIASPQDTLQVWLTDVAGTAAQSKASSYETPDTCPSWPSTLYTSDSSGDTYWEGYETGTHWLRTVWDFGD